MKEGIEFKSTRHFLELKEKEGYIYSQDLIFLGIIEGVSLKIVINLPWTRGFTVKKNHISGG